jgi:hypothetical protein
MTLHRHNWSGGFPDWQAPEIEGWVRGDVEPLVDEVGGRPVLIGKSLGTNAAGLAADRSLPAVWLTPLLTYPWVVDAMARATAPFLLVGGTGDRLWDSTVARRLSPHVVEIPDGDHGLFVPGPMIDTIRVLGQVVEEIDRFLGQC